MLTRFKTNNTQIMEKIISTWYQLNINDISTFGCEYYSGFIFFIKTSTVLCMDASFSISPKTLS